MARPKKGNFTERTKQTLADRAGNVCSFPDCGRPTSGPNAEAPDRAVNLGEAAHIESASPGGRRYDASMTHEARRHIDNGIWLCGTHHKLVDSDEATYTVVELRQWKVDAETRAKTMLRTGTSPFSSGSALLEPEVPPGSSWSAADGPITSPALEAAYERLAVLEAEGADRSETLELNQEIARLRAEVRGDRPHLEPGDYLDDGRFRLKALLGAGRFADVWLAYDRTSPSIVAVKVLDSRFARDENKRRRFFRGAREMVRLRDVPEVVNVLDFKENQADETGHHFFVMEYVGEDLRQAVVEGTCRRKDWVEIIVSIGRALSCAHARHIFHRDVKPSNILLDREGRPKLTDFDLVRAADTHGETKTSTSMGTIVFAAPEAMTDGAEAREPADVFGLGMTALFLVHGKDLPLSVFRDPKPLLASLDISVEVRAVLERAVAWEVEDRWQTADAFCDALQLAVTSPGSDLVNAVLPSLVPGTQKPPAVYPGDRPPWASSWGLDAYGRFCGIEVGGVEQRLRWIGPGRFRMGSPESEGGRLDGEGPVYDVVIEEGFWLAETPCIQAFWHAVMGSRPSHFKGDDRPVESVSFEDCRTFTAALDAQLGGGWGARLPSESEWECACRAGSDGPTYLGDATPEVLDRIAWYGANASYATQPVAGKAPNAWGLYDTLGNVWEWCSDRWSTDYQSPRDGTKRVIRGGSWSVHARLVRAASRDANPPGDRYPSLGFRLSRGPGAGGR